MRVRFRMFRRRIRLAWRLFRGDSVVFRIEMRGDTIVMPAGRSHIVESAFYGKDRKGDGPMVEVR